MKLNPLVAAVLAGFITSASAELFIYEPFDYLTTEPVNDGRFFGDETQMYDTGLGLGAWSHRHPLLALVCALVPTLVLGLFVVRPIITGALQNSSESGPALPAPDANSGDPTGLDLPALDGAAAGGSEALPNLDFGGSMGADSALPELPMMGGGAEPADRLRNMIEERQTETVEILRGWLEDKEEAA